MKPFLTRPKKILVIKLRSLGETVLFSASVQALKEAFPETQIHVAVTTPWAPLLIHHPAISRIWPIDRHTDKLARARSIARAALSLRQENFDCVINFHASPSSATLAFATGAKVRSIHFHSGRDKNRYSTLAIPDKGVVKSVLEKDLDAIRALGVSVDSTKIRPAIFLKPTEMNLGFQTLEQLGLKRPVLALGLGSSRPTKCWSLDRFTELASRWKGETQGSVLLVTGPGEKARGEQILAKLGDRSQVGHVHEPDIRTLSAIFTQCSVFAGNDSGVRHLAAASATPTVTLVGPEDPREWHPYSREQHPLFYVENLPCRKDAQPGYPPWCALQECVVEKHRCMEDIEVGPVFEACRRIMK